jgi:hypothetical protein
MSSVTLAIAALGLGWTALLLVTSGVEASVFGFTLKSHNFRRPA